MMKLMGTVVTVLQDIWTTPAKQVTIHLNVTPLSDHLSHIFDVVSLLKK